MKAGKLKAITCHITQIPERCLLLVFQRSFRYCIHAWKNICVILDLFTCHLQSYGGFVTAHAIGHPDNDVFTCGVAVAPVTDFRYYGMIFN